MNESRARCAPRWRASVTGPVPRWLVRLAASAGACLMAASAAPAAGMPPAAVPSAAVARASAPASVPAPARLAAEAPARVATALAPHAPWPAAHVLGNPVGEAGLAGARGGSATPWSEMKLDGAVGNNSATHVVTGANIISDGAFSNTSGLPMVIQNSGANVLIQNATIVNVQFQ